MPKGVEGIKTGLVPNVWSSEIPISDTMLFKPGLRRGCLCDEAVGMLICVWSDVLATSGAFISLRMHVLRLSDILMAKAPKTMAVPALRDRNNNQ